MATPSSICSDLRSVDSDAYEHCLQTVPKYSPRREEINTGTTYVDFTDRMKPVVKKTHEPEITPQEYYQWVFDKIEKNPTNRRLVCSLRKKTGVKVPYVFVTCNAAEQKIGKRTLKANKAFIRRERNNPEPHARTAESNLALIDALKKHISAKLKIRSYNNAPTKSALGTAHQKLAHCMGFTNIYFGLGLLVGLKPRLFSVEWDEKGRPIDHHRLAFEYNPTDSNKLYIIDPARGVFGLPVPGEIQVPISSLDHTAVMLVNELKENPSMRDAFKYKKIGLALKLAPRNFRVLLAALGFYEEKKDWEKACHYFEKVLEVYPHPEELRTEYPKTAALVSSTTHR